MPAETPLISSVTAPVLQEKVYGLTPPVTERSILPFEPPLQDGGVATAVGTGGTHPQF